MLCQHVSHYLNRSVETHKIVNERDKSMKIVLNGQVKRISVLEIDRNLNSKWSATSKVP